MSSAKSGETEMPQNTVEDTLDHLTQSSMETALAHHRGGRLDQARTMYLAVLALQPDHPDANHNMGALAVQSGQAELALPYFSQALASNHRNWQYWISWVDGLIQADQVNAAAQLLEQARRAGLAQAAVEELVNRMVELPWLPVSASDAKGEITATGDVKGPSALEIVHITGLLNQNQFDAMEAYARRLVEIYPANVLGWKMLGIALSHQGKQAEALECDRRMLGINPDDAQGWDRLGMAVADKGELIEGEVYARRALRANPLLATAHLNLGWVLHRQGHLPLALQCFTRSLEIDPSSCIAHLNLSVVLDEMGYPEQAEIAIRDALQIAPDFAQGHRSLGFLLKNQGRLDEAQASTRRAIELNPMDTAAYSNLLFLLNYHPDKSAEEIFEAYQEFDAQHGLPYKALWQAHQNSDAGQRRLRVGYVCATFSRHSTRYFLEPLLAHHDHSRLEVFAYSELTAVEDEFTARYRRYADHWVTTVGMDDDALAQRIRDDGIDVLVDVAGQTRGNRLGVFARKPAPVSLHWLDFGYTTGLSAIDYYLTDELTAPPGSEHLFAEAPWRLPVPALVYRPPADTGPVNPLPSQQRGYVTFGTLTRSIRINHRTLRAWAEILRRVPGSRLVIDSGNFKDEAAQAELGERFVALGTDPSRLDIGFHSPPWDVLRSFDIALDCFPHNSGTTLLESLYMGVPYVTLAGRPSVGRLGAALLQGVGHPELIATSEADYVDKLVALAQDPERLGRLRAKLRGDLESSPLMDEAGFARQVESAYNAMFLRWLESGGKAVSQPSRQPQDAITEQAAFKNELHESMQLALDQHRAGKLDVAEEMYRAILQVAPAHPDANHNLAVIALENGHAAASLPYFRKALDAEPGNWQYWLSYFDAVLQAGQCHQAIEMLELRRRHGLASEVLAELVTRAVDALYLAHTQRAHHPRTAAPSNASRARRPRRQNSCRQPMCAVWKHCSTRTNLEKSSRRPAA
jgi:protein O-GlcNAc transferase